MENAVFAIAAGDRSQMTENAKAPLHGKDLLVAGQTEKLLFPVLPPSGARVG